MNKNRGAKQTRDMEEVAGGIPTKAEGIRALCNAGYTPSEIQSYLGVSQRQVRDAIANAAPKRVRAKIGPGGRIVIPAPYRRELGLKDGDLVILQLDNGDIRIISPAVAGRRAQALVAKYVPEGVSLVDELIAERRRKQLSRTRVSSAVLDASALLAYFRREPGADVVGTYLTESIISAVNIAEAGARLADWGILESEIHTTLASLGPAIVAFDETSAIASAALRPITRHLGLSLGDRACLALAVSLGLPALTADRQWADLDIGVEVRLIRG